MASYDPCSRKRTAFTNYTGLYIPVQKIIFSLGNAPATFQRLLEEVLSGLARYMCASVVYMDDVLVFGFMVAEYNAITSIRYWNNFAMPDYP